MTDRRFPGWAPPTFDERGMTPWNWMCQHPENLDVGHGSDIGAFTYINARYGVRIAEGAQVGSHCSIYSVSTIDGREGAVSVGRDACVGAHSVVLPGVRIGDGAVVGACSLVNRDIPPGETWVGVPARPLQEGSG